MPTNLYTASNQWATRPASERFLTLDELKASVTARRMRSNERNLAVGRLGLEYDQSDNIYVNNHNGKRVEFTNWSFTQFATLAGAPAGYLRSLPAPLAVLNLQYALENTPAGSVERRMLYSTPEPGREVGTARAFNGTTYGTIWDAQVVEQVELINQDNRWHVPLKAYDGVNSKQATTLYASDRDVFIFLVDENRPIDIDGQTYYRGFFTWNSETGARTFGLSMFLYSRVCANRIIWDAREVEEVKIRHTSTAPDRFAEVAQPALAAMSNASAEPIIARIKAAKQTRIGKTVADVEQWLKGKGFGKAESSAAINLAIAGGESGASGDPTNVWDIVQGGTASARSIKHADDRVDAERKWAALLPKA